MIEIVEHGWQLCLEMFGVFGQRLVSQGNKLIKDGFQLFLDILAVSGTSVFIEHFQKFLAASEKGFGSIIAINSPVRTYVRRISYVPNISNNIYISFMYLFFSF